MEIIECVCSVLSLLVSIISLFFVKNVSNNIREVKAKIINGDINFNG